MSSKFVRILGIVLLFVAVVGFALALSPSITGSANSPVVDHVKAGTRVAGTKAPTRTPQPATATPTSTPEPVSIPGSTDGIEAMGFVIVLIILLPILLQWRLWLR